MASLSTSIMFLLGAGASHGAGINGIGKMSELFYKYIEDLASEHLIRTGGEYSQRNVVELSRLLKTTIEKSGKEFNIELLLEALVNLESKDHILFDILDYKKKFQKYDGDYYHFKNILFIFLRKQCENIGNVNYLFPLTAFIRENNVLNIFTLNYDGTIEKMCKENNVYYTDGFSEEWDSKLFEEDKFKIRLYKLHGSLYWFKTELGKYIKLPIKYIEVKKLMYFMDEEITETLIWPMITKDYSTGPIPWLMENFREKLRACDICYVLGYSFRDDYIKTMVLDEMQNNSNLWLFIVDHHALSIKKKLCENKMNLKERIIVIEDDIEKVLLNRTLIEKNRHISTARNREEQYKNSLLFSKNIDSREWKNVFDLYRSIPHLDRIKSLSRYVLDNYESERETIPSLQWYLFDLSLRFGIESYIDADYTDSIYWLTRFNECSIVLDWIMGRGVSKEFILVSNGQIPFWAKNPDEYAKHFSDLNYMRDSLEVCIKILDQDKELQKIINDYLEAMEIYTKNIESGVELRQERISELRENGLVWSNLTKNLHTRAR